MVVERESTNKIKKLGIHPRKVDFALQYVYKYLSRFYFDEPNPKFCYRPGFQLQAIQNIHLRNYSVGNASADTGSQVLKSWTEKSNIFLVLQHGLIGSDLGW
ncbi:hypothetical protein A0J61_00502 [Choanephora cucurbitarum]|uniref:Uncharacterized protein n=1 Tax=Choanephora cucurbitarum TaxID=101091 RepID=A0A1C7NVC5_9FUNG|nr:hypothetical protein A0J61_00502 [Choanephora cucurbitarum]